MDVIGWNSIIYNKNFFKNLNKKKKKEEEEEEQQQQQGNSAS